MAVPILRQVEFNNRFMSRSRRGNEADRRRAEAALWRVAKAEGFFAQNPPPYVGGYDA